MGDRNDPPLQKSLTSTDFRLTNAFFNGLQFKVEQGSRGLSAIAELLVQVISAISDSWSELTSHDDTGSLFGELTVYNTVTCNNAITSISVFCISLKTRPLEFGKQLSQMEQLFNSQATDIESAGPTVESMIHQQTILFPSMSLCHLDNFSIG